MQEVIEKVQKIFKTSPWRRPELLACVMVHAMTVGETLERARVIAEEALPDPEAPKPKEAKPELSHAEQYAQHFGEQGHMAPGPVVSPFEIPALKTPHDCSFWDGEAIVGDLAPTNEHDGDRFDEPV